MNGFNFAKKEGKGMLFTAPAFIFLFLPLSVLFVAIFGKVHRRLCLCAISAAYCVLLNIQDPINILCIPLLTVFAFFAARLATALKARAVGIVLGVAPILWLAIMRTAAYTDAYGFVYPVGITMPALCASAYIFDASRSGEAEKNIGKLWSYLSFFPLMILGPFIGYSRFCELTDDKNVRMGLERGADGVLLFVTGFVKRVAVGAVLLDGYEKIFSYSWETPNVTIIVLLIVLIYFGIFFSVSGYYDMSVGLCRIYGIDVREIKANPFSALTVEEYGEALFVNVKEWSRTYLVAPVCRLFGVRGGEYVGAVITCICVVLAVRTDMTALALALPIGLFACLSRLLHLEKRGGRRRTGLRVLFGMLMMLIIGVLWIFVTLEGGAQAMIDYIGDISLENAEYQTDLVLIAFSGAKYLLVSLIGLFLLVPRMGFAERAYDRSTERTKIFWSSVRMISLLAVFVMTVVVFSGSAAAYDQSLFKYVII